MESVPHVYIKDPLPITGVAFRVLMVSSDSTFELLLNQCFKKAGFQVRSQRVDSLKDLNDILRHTHLHLLIIDTAFPQTSALNLVQQIRLQNRDVPLLVIGEHIGESQVAALFRAGMDDFLLRFQCTRPVFSDVVHRLVLRAIRVSNIDSGYQECFEQIINYAHDAIYISTPEGRLIKANAAFFSLFGYRPEDITRLDIRDLYVNPEERKALRQLLQQQDFVENYEVQLRHREGQALLCRLTVAAWRDSQGRIRGYHGIVRDITRARRTSDALQESLQFVRNILDNVQEGIAVYDIEGRCQVWNHYLEHLTGIPAASVLGREVTADFPVFESTRVHGEALKKVFAGEVVRIDKLEYIHPRTQEEIYYSVTYAPYRNAWGKIAGAIANFHNVTEIYRVQQQLRESEQRYRIVSELSSDYAYAIRIDDSGTFIPEWITDAFTRITGYTPEEVQHMGGILSIVHPEDHEHFMERLEQLRAGKPYSGEWRLIDRKGQIHWIRESSYPMQDVEGKLIRIFSAGRDITNEKEALLTLAESEARYRALSEVISAYAYQFAVHPDGSVENEWVTDSVTQVLGYTPEELKGRSWEFLAYPEDLPIMQERTRKILAGESVINEYRVRTKDGQVKWLRLYAYPEWDQKTQRVVRFYGAGYDVTLQKEAELELIRARQAAEQMAQLKSTILTNLSHEIRTPLAGIIGFAQILREEVEGELAEFVELIEQSGQRLLETLNAVLDLARIESRSLRLQIEAFDLIKEVQYVLQQFQPRATEKGLELLFPDRRASFKVAMDREVLRRILSHLISNALKFTAQGSVIIRVFPSTEEVEFRVIDTGIGISKEFLPELFKEFTQESTGDSRIYAGSGLGLPITRRLVEMMGGTIQVESEPGKGSTFIVRLPRYVNLQT